MMLSKRLACVASFVDGGAFIADVGSDHAQVPLFLFDAKRIRGAEAIENKKGPYGRMAKAILSSPYADRTILSLSDGISSIDPQVDTVILAGMGGRLIEEILCRDPQKLSRVNTLIIDAHSEREELYAFLGRLSFEIVGESFFFDQGIAYDVIKALKRGKPIIYSEKECRFGPLNLQYKNPDFIAFWSAKARHLEELLKLPDLSKENTEAYRKELISLQEVLHEH